MLKKWDNLPEWMKNSEVRKYYDNLSKQRWKLSLKRFFDVVVAIILLILLSGPMLIIAFMIAVDSSGEIFYRQERITAYGRKFRIHKFRTMVANADQIGSHVTVGADRRITRVGTVLRKYRLDEIPQLIDILEGSMSFVGARPEIPKYVKKYSREMRATLLLPAGITSEASIRYKNEAVLLAGAADIDKVYVEEILPGKMKYNLEALRKFSIMGEIATMLRTVLAVAGKEYE